MTKQFPTVAVGPLAMLLAITAATIAHAAADTSASAVPTLTPIPPTPALIAPLDERTLATVIVDNPDTMVAAHGSLWVKTDDGRVVRVDPKTNTVVADVKVDTTATRTTTAKGWARTGQPSGPAQLAVLRTSGRSTSYDSTPATNSRRPDCEVGADLRPVRDALRW